MPTTTISVTSFQTAIAECADAVAAGDWATAWSKLAVAELINDGLEKTVAGSVSSVERRESLLRTAQLLEKAQAAATAATATSSGGRTIRTRTNYA